MLKTVIIPNDRNVLLEVPTEYIGKKVKISYEIEVVDINKVKKDMFNPSDFVGTISKEEGEEFHKYVEESRSGLLN